MEKVGKIEIISNRESVQFSTTWSEQALGQHFLIKNRFDILMNAILEAGFELDKPLRVLDIGSGNGIIREQFEKATPWSIDCADIDKTGLARLPEGRGKNFFYDITDLSSKMVASYDLIFMLDVIEHIANTGPFLTAALKHLKPGGGVLVHVPACPQVFSIYDEAAGHERRYTMKSLLEEVKLFEFKNLRCHYWALSMLPVLHARKFVLRFVKPGADVIQLGFVPPSPIINWLLWLVLRVERIFGYPFYGTNLVLTARLDKCGGLG